jgi:hypothetical protein
MQSPDQTATPKSRNQLDEEFHARYCAVRNVRTAWLFVAFFAVEVFVSWRGLDKPFQRPSLIELPFFIVTIAIGVRWLLVFKCVMERLVLGISLINFVAGLIFAYVPTIGTGTSAELIRSGKLSLWVFALIVSLGMLVLSARSIDTA